jgi:hypothetical protein
MDEKEEKEIKGPKIDELKNELNKYEWQLLRVLQHYNDKTRNGCEIHIVKEPDSLKVSARNSWMIIKYRDGKVEFDYMKYGEIPKKQQWYKRIQFTIEAEEKRADEMMNIIIDAILKMPMDIKNLVRATRIAYATLTGKKISEGIE